MNSNKRPTTITAKQFVDDGYAKKVKAGECVVTDPVGDIITDNHEGNGDYIWLAWESEQGFKGMSGYTFTHPLTVEWLPIPPSRYADLLPQTVDTVRYGTPEFEQLAREDAEAEIARLQAEVARLREALEKIAAPIPQRVIEFWHTKNMKPEDVIAGCLSIARRALDETTATTEEPDHR